jgi:D-galactarolactone cycloisomerase
LQFIATLPPAPLGLSPIEPILEYDQSDHPFRQALIFDALRMEDGMVQIPNGPGLGIEVNREVLAQYALAH